MNTLDSGNIIDRSDVQNSSQQLSDQQGKLNSDLLWIANGNSMLRASLILLTIVIILFTVMKICKLTYQIQYRYHREQKTRKSTSEIPQITVRTDSANSSFSPNEKRNQKKRTLSRTSRRWKTKSNLNSNSLLSKKMKANISLSTESDSMQAKSEKTYSMLNSSLKSSTKSTEMKDAAQSQH
uniref:Uncharacterized protein n=1 Tax=Onchocerca volvulus TaxID=6282 RepID=A0A8R1Y279_ONCVO